MDLSQKNIQRLTKAGDQLFAERLSDLKKHGGVIVLFGAGEGGRRMKKLLAENGITVSFFTDNKKSLWGSTIDGTPVLSPKEAVTLPFAYVVISASEVGNISATLRDLHVTDFEKDLYLMCITKDYRQVFAKHLAELRKVEKLLSEKKSLQTFCALVEQTFCLDTALLSKVYDTNQYFFSPRFAIRLKDVVVDAGAFTGDTVSDIIRRFGRGFGAVHCFEPNKENAENLKAFVKKNKLTNKVIIHVSGLSDRAETMYFSGEGVGYHATTAEDPAGEKISTVTLDGALLRQHVDVIKMDIEGFEPKAIRGATEIIRRDTPRLAICIYHEPEHFWEIPLMLAKLLPSYTFYLRHHSLGRLETVWYASPTRV